MAFKGGPPDIRLMVSRPGTDRYLGLDGNYRGPTEDFLRKRDYSEASEEFGGAYAEIVKTVAATRGKHVRTSADLFEFIKGLSRANPELGRSRDFLAASQLHSNFYEDELPDGAGQELADAARTLVRKMRQFL